MSLSLLQRMGLLGVLAGSAFLAYVSPSPAQIPVLAGETVLEGSTAGYLEVRLPEDHATFSQTGGTIQGETSGGGGVAGAVLLEAGPDPGRDRDDLMLLRVGPRDDGFLLLSGGELRAGIYHLYLYTDGQPASIRLRFSKLSGSATMTPDRSMPFVAGPLEPRPGFFQGVTKWGRSARIAEAGGRSVYWSLPRTQSELVRQEKCWYPYSAETKDTYYEPTCPDGGLSYAPPPGTGGGLWSVGWYPDAGDHGHGGNLTHIGAPIPVDSFSMWASFEPKLAARPTTGGSPPQPQSQPPPANSPPASAPVQPRPALVTARRLAVRGRIARVPVHCPAATRCRATLRIGRRQVDFVLGPDKRVTLRFKLSRTLARRVARRRAVSAHAVVNTFFPEGQMQTKRRVRLVAKARGSRPHS